MLSNKLTISALASVASSLLLSASPAVAQTTASTGAVTPSAPGPGEVFTAGQQCSTSWTPATSNRWRNMTIELMTGSNLQMVPLAVVATGIDGTDSSQTTYTYTCPEMSLYSAVYFYQYTHGNEQDPTWTTRFTIQSPEGESVNPPNSTVSGGETIYFGTGGLLNPAAAVATGSVVAVEGTAAATTTITGTGSGSEPTGTSGSSSAASNTTTEAASTQSGMTTSTTAAANSTTSTANSTTTGASSGAATSAVVSSLGALFAVSAAVVALL